MPIYLEISRLHRCVTIVARGALEADEIMGAAQQLFEARVPEFAKVVDVPGWQIPLIVLGLILVISLPSMFIAALKLRHRTLGPILEANGWAINGRVKINIPFGAKLTKIATLPPESAPVMRKWMSSGPMRMVSSEGLGIMSGFSICQLGFAIESGTSLSSDCGLLHLGHIELDFEELFAGFELDQRVSLRSDRHAAGDDADALAREVGMRTNPFRLLVHHQAEPAAGIKLRTAVIS